MPDEEYEYLDITGIVKSVNRRTSNQDGREFAYISLQQGDQELEVISWRMDLTMIAQEYVGQGVTGTARKKVVNGKMWALQSLTPIDPSMRQPVATSGGNNVLQIMNPNPEDAERQMRHSCLMAAIMLVKGDSPPTDAVDAAHQAIAAAKAFELYVLGADA